MTTSPPASLSARLTPTPETRCTPRAPERVSVPPCDTCEGRCQGYVRTWWCAECDRWEACDDGHTLASRSETPGATTCFSTWKGGK
jgi:hypothetical protein